MPNIKSAKKRVVTSAKRAERNKAVKSELKTTIKKFDAAIAENDKAVVDTAFREAVKMVDQAAAKGVIKKEHRFEKEIPARDQGQQGQRVTYPVYNLSPARAGLCCFARILQAGDRLGGSGPRRARLRKPPRRSRAAAGPPEKEAGTAGRRGGEWRRLFFAPCLPAGDGAGRARRLREGTTEAGPLAGRAKKAYGK